MKYLFFDIECANVFRGICKMCEFGYVLTDENFNVLRKEEFVMSPGNKKNRFYRFDQGVFKRDPNFRWAYAEDDYYDSPEFPVFYEKVKQLLENKNTLVFGHSVENDVRYLVSTLKRYNLEPYSFIAYDTQVMMNYFSEKRIRFMGLETAFKALYSLEEFNKLQPHLSSDDALMTMRVVSKMCEMLEVTLSELIELTPGSKMIVENSTIKRDEVVNVVQPKKRKKKGEYNISKKAQVLWGEFYRSYTHLVDAESSKGKLVTISAKVKQEIAVLQSVIDKIKEQELIPCDKIGESNFLIVSDQEDKEKLLKIFQHPYNGHIITIEDFMDSNY